MPAHSPLIWILLVFSIWMLSDAIRRRAGWFWYLVILVAPLGAVIYFVAVKLPNLSSRTGAGTQGPGLKLDVKPSLLVTNLDRADRLEESDQYDEAMPIYQAALERDATDLRALHGTARCELGLGHPLAAVALLEQVLNTDRAYRNYAVALDYADALWLAGQKQDTLDLLRGLAELTNRINHRLALAHYLAETGQFDDAKGEVQRAIQTHAEMPADEQARQRRWLDRANEMLAQWH